MRPRSKKEIANQRASDPADPHEAKSRKLYSTEFLDGRNLETLAGVHTDSRQMSWRYSAPAWLILGSSLGIGLGIFVATLAFELLLRWYGSTSLVFIVGSDLLAGSLACLLHYTTIHSLRRRRAMVLHRLQLIADMNHHIRNALEVIQLSTALVHNPEIAQIINESTERITWALKEILGNEPMDQ
jgi:signal transduction histidine kinase